MKYLIRLLAVIVVISACSQPTATEEHPESLEGKRSLLQKKQAELQEVTNLIDRLEKEIAELDPVVKARQRRLVNASTVELKDFQHFVEIQGSVQADDLVDVTSEAAGRIIRLTVKEGQNVRAGQLIAELDLDQLKKQIAELETSLSLATTVYERQKRLWDQNIGSELQFLEAKNNKERLEKSLETLEYQLSKAKVYAPASGIVDRVVLQSGELASPGQPIVQVLNLNKLKVVADVPENYLPSVKRGEKVTVRFPALSLEEEARITLIGSTIDPGNRTFKVEAALRSSNRLLKPNLLAVMLIQDFELADAVIVPLEMVQQEVGGKDFVYIIAEDEEGLLAKKVYVKTGKSYKGEVIIKQGLEGGEQLITTGARGLAENERIQVQEEKQNG